MSENSRTQSAGSRHWFWLGAAGLFVLASGVWVAVKPDVSPSRKARPPVPDTAEQPISPNVPPLVARAESVRPPPKKAAPPPPLPVAPPDDTGPIPPDPLEPQHGQNLEIRTLVTVGDLQLGLVGDARVRDERGLK